MTEPIYKDHAYKVMEQAPEAKCISLLSQVMDEFRDTLSPGEIDAVAAWFGKNYKLRMINPPLYFEGNGKVSHIEGRGLKGFWEAFEKE